MIRDITATTADSGSSDPKGRMDLINQKVLTELSQCTRSYMRTGLRRQWDRGLYNEELNTDIAKIKKMGIETLISSSPQYLC